MDASFACDKCRKDGSYVKIQGTALNTILR